MASIGVAIIGTGGIVLENHLPGMALAPQSKLVALCDSDEATLARAGQQTGVKATFSDYRAAIAHPGVDAVIIATPNITHPPIALAAIAVGKHVLCEKPLALDLATARRMLDAAEKANVRHMTAFTYRFAPAMRYAKHLVERGDLGTPMHFRAQRFQDWGERALGWRQVKELAGTGEMGDMLSHRIDYAHHLIGPIKSLVADLRTFLPVRSGVPTDVDDWVALITRFDGETSGVLESTKLATGRGAGLRGQDIVEINGTEGSLVYSTQKPLELQFARRGEAGLRTIDVPNEFLVYPGSPRDPSAGDPLMTFRYDQSFEFIDAIANRREASPSFRTGVAVQAVMEAALQSHARQAWVDVPQV